MDTTLLKKLFPTLLVRNMQNTSQHIYYSNGDSAMLHPGETNTIQSSISNGDGHIMQVPDPSIIRLINPSIGDLIAAGVIPASLPPPAAVVATKTAPVSK